MHMQWSAQIYQVPSGVCIMYLFSESTPSQEAHAFTCTDSSQSSFCPPRQPPAHPGTREESSAVFCMWPLLFSVTSLGLYTPLCALLFVVLGS